MPVTHGGTAPKSLVISSNLDALLEFDRKTRPRKSGSQTGSVGSVSSDVPVSLPAPPRGPRRTPQSPKPVQEIFYTPPPRNPYINSSPVTSTSVPSSPFQSEPQLSPGRVLTRTPTRSSSMSANQQRYLAQHGRQQTDSPQPESQRPRGSNKLVKTQRGPAADNASDRVSFIELGSPTEFADMAERSESRPMKPPVPTSPKPVFNIPSSSAKPSSWSSRPSLSDSLTSSNLLAPTERQDLVRKSQKIAHFFGKTPAASFLDVKLSDNAPVWPPPEGTLYISANDRRRHSSPLTPDGFSFLSEVTSDQHSVAPSDSSSAVAQSIRPNSFMDLDLDEDEDGISAIIADSPKKPRFKQRDPGSPSAQSFFENLSPEEQAEEERRRKREKLARINRFLGSRVPQGLVLGISDSSPSLPPPDEAAEDRKTWLKRRRSSSAAAFPITVADRLKEDLDEKEKAINVRRAIKMEKVFGVAPPQTLYHTRHTPSPSLPPATVKSTRSSSSEITAPSSTGISQMAYKPRLKKNDRPGTSESSKQLLPKGRGSSDLYADDSPDQQPEGYNHRTSAVYNHYQHSLNSLNDIIDRDDRASLVELHEYLNSPEASPQITPTAERRMSITSIKSERRRSLPVRTSLLSLASEYNKAEVSDFELRRRRAAKLTNFFGVQYRDLIRDVLESLESGLEVDQSQGVINPEEAEELRRKLRNIKTKREAVS